jgi:hypothetical protein
VSYRYGQAILVHSGVRITIADNKMNDVLAGIAVAGYTRADTTHDVTITGNTYRGTRTGTAPKGEQNSGIALSGAADFKVTHVVVTNNTISEANVIGDLYSQGGLRLTMWMMCELKQT